MRLVLFGDGKSLSVLGKLIEHVAALSAGVSIGVISHVGSRRALFAFNLELNNFASVVNVEVRSEEHTSELQSLVSW